MLQKKLLIGITYIFLQTFTLNAYVQPYCATPPHLTPRSQGEHIERLNTGLTNYLTKAATDDHYGTFSITPAYSRSFKPTALAANLFGDFLQTNRRLTIAGSNADPVANESTDIRAEWLYLPSTYRGSIYFDPLIQNFITDFDLYWGMDNYAEGLFARIRMPFVHTRWNLDLESVVEQVGAKTVGNITSLGDHLDYFCNEKTPTGYTWSVDPLSYTRICDNSCSKNGVADIHVDLGWKFLIDDNFHLGLLLRTVAPTGTRNNGTLLFAPVIGNGHHWELGGGLTSSYLMWHNEECEDRLALSLDLYVTHLFNTKECRVFDLKNKPLSRYMTAAKIINDANIDTFAPIANITASRVNVRVNAQVDLALWFDFTHKNMTANLGYNLWARSCEKVSCASCKKCSSCCPNILINSDESWGIRDFSEDGLTASDATITSLGNADATPVYLTSADLDFRGGATRGMSHSLFGHISYNWFDKINVPYIGLGGSIEFAHSNGCKPASPCESSCNSYHACSCAPCCRKVALSQWTLWIKGGIAF